MPTLNFDDLAALPAAASAPGAAVGTNYLATFGVTVSAAGKVRNWNNFFAGPLPGRAGFLRNAGSSAYTVTIDPVCHFTGLALSWIPINGFTILVTGRNGVSSGLLNVSYGSDWSTAQDVPFFGIDEIASITMQANSQPLSWFGIAEMIFTGTGPPPQPAPDIWPGRCEAWPAGDKFR